MTHDALVRLRHSLHQIPELSGCEADTASLIAEFMRPLQPDQLIEGLGGHGLAVEFRGGQPGPTVLLRCELDALPIDEQFEAAYRSARPGVAHKCGHDGHMAALAAVGVELAARRPERGRVILLFQPAEETGQGAAAVIADPRFAQIRPDFCFAFHNLPGVPLGQVVIREGPFTCASRGVALRFTGATAHAAQPETGRSPAAATARVIQRLGELPWPLVPPGEIAFVTVVGARLGEKAFGTAPGQANVWATLRSETDATMAALVRYVEQVASAAAEADGLDLDIQYEDIFPATVNSGAAAGIVARCAEPGRLQLVDAPFRWSEDFGHFTALGEGALFGIGAGLEVPDLHDARYDFPDELIPIAQRIFTRIVTECLDGPGKA